MTTLKLPLVRVSLLAPDEVLQKSRLDHHGLSSAEVLIRRKQAGLNEITTHEVAWYDIALRQFRSAFVYLLLVAALITTLLGEYIDASFIFLFVFLNAGLGFYQEFHSHKALQLLKQFLAIKTRVIREGKEQRIDSIELVPGDLVVVQAGDVMPADLRFVTANDITVDESMLTGESTTVEKTAQPLTKLIKEAYQAKNIGFSGTMVMSGQGEGVVMAIGKKTTLGEIAKVTTEAKRISGFEKNIGRFSSFVIRLVLVTLVFVFLANVVLKGWSANWLELLIFSIALTVSVIPEALPVVTTFSLSRGALRLAKHKVVVRRLSAIEDLGGIEILCTDKTGTLTENTMSIKAVLSTDQATMLWYGALGASAAVRHRDRPPDPFDQAFYNKLTPTQKQTLNIYPVVGDIPFDPHRRYSTTVVKYHHGYRLVIRGAPETVLSLCPNVTDELKKKANQWLIDRGRQGYRVIAVAAKPISSWGQAAIKNEEHNLTYLGLAAFADPIKETAPAAIKKARALGITVKILTGDRPEVAASVAQEVGLIKGIDQVMTGEQFDLLHPSQQAKAVEDYLVFARVSPIQKYRIINLLQSQHEVGFLGEGINDAPALKAANVGLVVNDAADIARDAADIVILKQSLKVIVDGIEEGRSVFANTLKYIKATLSSNYGNFYAIAIASLLIPFLPMLPLQILLVNLLSDLPMISVATDSVDPAELAQPRGYHIRDIALIATILGLVSTMFDFIVFALFYRVSPAVLQTNWFISSILTELVFLFSIRSRCPFYKAKPPSTILVSLTILAAAVTVILPYTSFAQQTFHFIAPSIWHVTIILTMVVLYFAASESVKLLYYRYLEHKAG